jgi:hypothetical protein
MQQSKYSTVKIIHAMLESKYGQLSILPLGEGSEFLSPSDRTFL